MHVASTPNSFINRDRHVFVVDRSLLAEKEVAEQLPKVLRDVGDLEVWEFLPVVRREFPLHDRGETLMRQSPNDEMTSLR